MKNVFFAIGCILLFTSCNRNPFKVNLTDTTINFQFHAFGSDLFAAKDKLSEQLPELEKTYPDILPLFSSEIIAIGLPEDDGFEELLNSFVEDSLMQEVKKQVDEKINRDDIHDKLEEAFRYFHYYFPEKAVPEVFTCISGFNQSIIMTEKLMGIGLDKYLGRDCEYYPRLGIPQYQRINMHPDKIVPDALYAWAMTEFPFNDYGPHLIDRMIYEGKLLYLLDATLPETADSLKIGFTKKQLDFCSEKENAMWTYLAEYKMLFSTERMDVKRYVDASPYTSSFTADSPGRTGVWLGWQIVKAYMKKNPDVSIPDLMNEKNCKLILNQSAYQPE
ncbi:gliding motility lipoprotein GldB [Mangrovibacterium lignilyticum]|uniref:gliding motility lipoprotein GldB n=1 Tax=Mangrovibacterium lignilyticum TaxID=2668052 RepID=UPI0013D84DA8|nr:hypothetical protein [Mangrovibacterium lignilyticum]